MGTSLAELVDDLEHHLNGGRVVLGLAEAAAGLHATGPVLRRLAIDGLEPGASRGRESAAKALASACERAGQTWPTDPARRSGQLIGIIGDVLGLQRFELGCEARWWTTLRLASAARASGDVIAAREPYANHPYLKQVHAAAAAVQRLGAATLPDPAGLAGLDIRLPHPAGYRAGPAEVGAAEELTRIAALLRPTPDGRQPRLTVRQIQSVLHASAAAADYAQRQFAEHVNAPWHQTASAWTAARLALAPFTEGATPETTAHDPLLAASSRLCEQLAKAQAEPTPSRSGEALEVITSGLPHIARRLDLQIRMLTGRAIARATALPITEAHVDAWLGNTALLATGQQLQPTSHALRAADVLSTGLAAAISEQMAHISPTHATPPREPISIRRGTHAAAVAQDIAEQADRAQQHDLRLQRRIVACPRWRWLLILLWPWSESSCHYTAAALSSLACPLRGGLVVGLDGLDTASDSCARFCDPRVCGQQRRCVALGRRDVHRVAVAHRSTREFPRARHVRPRRSFDRYRQTTSAT